MSQPIHHLYLLLLLNQLAFCCFPGEYPNPNGACLQCDISCSTCTSQQSCDTCYDQMYLLARGNLIVCQVCYNVYEGCDICLAAGGCSSCQAGYLLQEDNTCFKCNNFFPYCLLCSAGAPNFCFSCMASYLLVNGDCQPYNGSTDLQFSNFPQPINQTQNDQSFLASPCDPSEVSLNGVCYPSIPFCEAYNQFNGSCLSCISIFIVNNGYCLPSALITGNISIQAQPLPSPGSLPPFPAAALTPNLPNQSNNSGNLAHSTPQNCFVLNSADQTKCKVCADGYTTVDAVPGICYPIN